MSYFIQDRGMKEMSPQQRRKIFLEGISLKTVSDKKNKP
jgi:hypothetical protein